MTLRGCFLLVISGNLPVRLTPPGRGHPHSVFAVGAKTPWYRARLTLGFGTRAASLAKGE